PDTAPVPGAPGQGSGSDPGQKGAEGSQGAGPGGWGTGGQGKFSWTEALRQADNFMLGLMMGALEVTPLGPILMIPGVKEAIAKPVGMDPDSGAWKAGGYVWDAIGLIGGGGGAAKAIGKEGATKGGGWFLKRLRQCVAPKNSFVAGTAILMGDGSYKAIEKVKVGDEVQATDPRTGKTEKKSVTALISGYGKKDLVKVTIDTDGKRGAKTGIVTATEGHPFWVRRKRAWVRAADLRSGMWLHTSAGLHTYNVRAGGAAVLVHNAGGDDWDEYWKKLRESWDPGDLDDDGYHSPESREEQKKEFERALKELKELRGHPLSEEERRILHEHITKRGYDYEVFPARLIRVVGHSRA
ncbi:polymorphic toxin-type HINT domain-containing protein, partial [Actinomadura rubrisoli]